MIIAFFIYHLSLWGVMVIEIKKISIYLLINTNKTGGI